MAEKRLTMFVYYYFFLKKRDEKKKMFEMCIHTTIEKMQLGSMQEIAQLLSVFSKSVVTKNTGSSSLIEDFVSASGITYLCTLGLHNIQDSRWLACILDTQDADGVCVCQIYLFILKKNNNKKMYICIFLFIVRCLYFETDLNFRCASLQLINAALGYMPEIDERVMAMQNMSELGFDSILQEMMKKLNDLVAKLTEDGDISDEENANAYKEIKSNGT
ncbi:hypothetical protein RFI_06454 [Reticulomyxa filosa]|uniref:Uncharacterized protein n=1 Tax=Reticulomyxa filosa TaxID=46433 RepID=X6NXD2_RETFI|nr:hypothetical protein RFI_06454 [Reticulomyxa filosa]|eukprot:ETO30666.1 hypothetical protein RFI_06454 [Reticulomyxa filosa]